MSGRNVCEGWSDGQGSGEKEVVYMILVAVM